MASLSLGFLSRLRLMQVCASRNVCGVRYISLQAAPADLVIEGPVPKGLTLFTDCISVKSETRCLKAIDAFANWASFKEDAPGRRKHLLAPIIASDTQNVHAESMASLLSTLRSELQFESSDLDLLLNRVKFAQINR